MTMVTDLQVPARVRPGDTVAIVSPCSERVFWVEHRFAQGRAYLESLGLRVLVMPHTGEALAGVAVSPEERAEDIHRAFLDPEVSVVLAAIGGDASKELLPYLDYDLIRSHPKVFQGYSDVTVLHWALMKFAGLRTFHGPALLSELGEYPTVPAYTDRYLRAAWFEAGPIRFEPAEAWTDEFLDWMQRLDTTRARRLRPAAGWQTLQAGVAEGPLIGGCLETICTHLTGSSAWVNLGGAIVVLETSEAVPSPAQVEGYLRVLGSAGALTEIAGIAFGRPYGYDDRNKRMLWQAIRRVVAGAGTPALAEVDCGHTDPMLTLPLGAPARLDATNGTLESLA
jgi:muramoyltetrapeptide carboxypeptidase